MKHFLIITTLITFMGVGGCATKEEWAYGFSKEAWVKVWEEWDEPAPSWGTAFGKLEPYYQTGYHIHTIADGARKPHDQTGYHIHTIADH